MTHARPVLYSFRRCPYAMRGRMALVIAGISCELREISLKAKPEAMIAASPKATVPVLVVNDGTVIEESLSIMRWALAQNDPGGWLDAAHGDAAEELIAACDGPFKHHLDRYKYYTRYDNADPLEHRAAAMTFIARLEHQLEHRAQLFGMHRTLADIAIFPFIRQFANHDRDWFDALPLPNLHGWLAAHLTSPLFTAAMQKEKPWQTGQERILFPAGAAC